MKARPPRAPAAAPAGSVDERRWIDLLIVLGIAVCWIAGAAIVTRGRPHLVFDVFRDMAYAENILAGRVWSDPALNGHPWWYPPGNPIAFAALARLTGRSLLDLYSSSILWLNVLNPVLLYFLVRSAARSCLAGLLAVAFVGLGSYWWLTHALAPMPSVQGLALNLVVLLAWHHAQPRGWPWLVATGVIAALSFWHHPLCGMVVVGAIGLQGAISLLRPSGDTRFALFRRAAIVCGVALVLAAPLIVHLLTLPKLNDAPLRWFAPELHDLRHALHAHAPLMLPLGLLGAWVLLRGAASGPLWAATYLLIGLAGALVGYLGHDLVPGVPYLIPHEFQWHAQIGLAICAAIATLWLAGRISNSMRKAAQRPRVRAIAVAAIVAVTLGPALRFVDTADRQLMRIDAGWSTTLDVCRWVREHVPIEAAVAVQPDAAYFLSGLTGRKVVALPLGHMNPASDARRRHEDIRAMLTTTDPGVFADLAARHRIAYLMALPGAGGAAAVRDLYGRWPILEPAAIDGGDILFYRVLSSISDSDPLTRQ